MAAHGQIICPVNHDCCQSHEGHDSCCSHAPEPSQARGVENPGVIDLLKHDAGTDEVSLVMVEPRPWDGSELQLFQLQEKFNAYVSFALDGELAEVYPSLKDKKLCLELECATAPDAAVLRFLEMVREQISFQDISLIVTVMSEGCGAGCACSTEA